jgi:hypothetical protein
VTAGDGGEALESSYFRDRNEQRQQGTFPTLIRNTNFKTTSFKCGTRTPFTFPVCVNVNEDFLSTPSNVTNVWTRLLCHG